MSFAIGLSLFISLFVGGLSFLVFRRRRWVAASATGTSLVVLLGWFLHPVCVQLTPKDVARFEPPIETRAETGMIGRPIFQRRDGDWYQCKAWIARALFF